MAAKVKVRKIKIGGKANEHAELNKMFNSVLGTGDIDMGIAYPRYLTMRDLCKNILNIFEQVIDSPFMRQCKEFAPQQAEIRQFCLDGRKDMIQLFNHDFSDYEWNLSLIDPVRVKLFAEDYEKMKRSSMVRGFVALCNDLHPYRKNFIDLEKLNYKFIINIAGSEWKPFQFTSLDLKTIFMKPGVGENTIRFFMVVLNRIYTVSHRLWDELMTPDIDIDMFVQDIASRLNDIRKVPGLENCGRAFDKIQESVDLLKTNFNSYYRDFVDSRDNSTIMQNFILDIGKNSKVDAVVSNQFMKIIAFIQREAKDHMNKPQIKMLFDQINKSCKDLQKGCENLTSKEETSAAAATAVEPLDPKWSLSASAKK